MTTTQSEAQSTYRLLKTDLAAKLGLRAKGGITYQLLADAEGQELYLTVIANEGGGYWSRELIPFTNIINCLSLYAEANLPFPSLLLRHVFVGRSSNNAPFLIAALRDLGLLQAAPGKPFQHQVAGDWSEWKSYWLSQPSIALVLNAPTVVSIPVEKAIVDNADASDSLDKVITDDNDNDDEQLILSLMMQAPDSETENEANEAEANLDVEDLKPSADKTLRRRKLSMASEEVNHAAIS